MARVDAAKLCTQARKLRTVRGVAQPRAAYVLQCAVRRSYEWFVFAVYGLDFLLYQQQIVTTVAETTTRKQIIVEPEVAEKVDL